MKSFQLTTLFVFCLLTAFAQNNLAPYFQLQSEAAPGSFPLLSTSVRANITGPIADVEVTQVYRNDHSGPIEALYIFPASTRSAVYHMEMRIFDRVITAEIMKKNEARQVYETAREEGKTASLLEQHRPNIFQMHVANILPGEEIKVVMRYTEFIIPDEQVYSFVYPTVVGPRYVSSDANPVVSASTSVPYTPEGQLPSSRFRIAVNLNMPVPVTEVTCNSHIVSNSKTGMRLVNITLDPGEYNRGNRDFILDYKLSGNEVLSGIQTYSDGEDNYFLCQLEPPARDTSSTPVPREYIFIIDVSGSMRGFPLDVSKTLMSHLLTDLKPSDKFNVLFFAGSAFMLNPASVPATNTNVQLAFSAMLQMQGGGGTEMLPAIKQAMSVPRDQGFSRSFIIITDGYVVVEQEAFEYVSSHLSSANFFAFGIGSSVNRHLIEGLAHAGRGEPFVVTDENSAPGIATRFAQYISHPVLTDISITGKDIDLIDIYPDYVPDLMSERPVYCFGKFKSCGNSRITITGRSGNKKFSKTLDVPEADKSNSALSYLWAREKIRYLVDFNRINIEQTRIEEITNLGLKYNLLTDYTSFVAVDHIKRVNSGEETKTVNQPLPLPQGVPNSAVGFQMSLDPILTGREALMLDVDVECEDELTQQILESVLELTLADTLGNKLVEWSGKSVTFIIDTNQGCTAVNGQGEMAQALSEIIREGLKRLGYAVARETEVTISITLAEIH